jgi:diacylglycerol O-acyltransferase / wax synthase
MRALVPVSVRNETHRGTLGNKLTVMRGPLPVYIHDPVPRLRFVRRAMDGLKESKQAVGAATLTAVNELWPPTILAEASRLNFSTRLFNLLVTNIPGPQVPLYVLGRQLEDLFPLAFLPKNHALAVAIMSYNGGLDYGLLGDYDALPDIDVIAEGIDASLKELLDEVARSRARKSSPNGEARAGEARNGGPKQILPSAGTRARQGPAADMRAKRAKRTGQARSDPAG